jgi:hypothetical protein
VQRLEHILVKRLADHIALQLQQGHGRTWRCSYRCLPAPHTKARYPLRDTDPNAYLC